MLGEHLLCIYLQAHQLHWKAMDELQLDLGKKVTPWQIVWDQDLIKKLLYEILSVHAVILHP